VLARDDVLGSLAALCRMGARLTVTLNGEIWLDSTPVRYESLRLPTPEYVAEVVAAGLARVGISSARRGYSSAAEAKALPTTWARRLGHGRTHPSFVALRRRARLVGLRALSEERGIRVERLERLEAFECARLAVVGRCGRVGNQEQTTIPIATTTNANVSAAACRR